MRRDVAFPLAALLPVLAAGVAAATMCDHDEDRRLHELAPNTARSSMSDVGRGGPYSDNPWSIAQGKQLYRWFNCVGCHHAGGGGIGPALMDDDWIYGSRPEDIFESIVEGRPNGMPAFGGKIPTHQVWQLVGYVQAMGGELDPHVAPGRADTMHVRPPEAITPAADPGRERR